MHLMDTQHIGCKQTFLAFATNLMPFTSNPGSFITASNYFTYCWLYRYSTFPCVQLNLLVVDSDRSWEVTRRNFKTDVSFKEHSTGQTVIDHILTIQNKFPTHFKDRFLLSTHHQSLLTHVTRLTMQAMSITAVEPLISLKLGMGLSTLVT